MFQFINVKKPVIYNTMLFNSMSLNNTHKVHKVALSLYFIVIIKKILLNIRGGQKDLEKKIMFFGPNLEGY